MKPLYQEVADDISAKIMSGEYPDGYQLLKEIDLAKKYAVSRVTVQKAMKILVDDGKVYRVSGKGTFVGAPRFSPERAVSSKNVLGILLCNFSASYGMDLLKTLESQCARCGFSVLFANSYYDSDLESMAIKRLFQCGARGIFIQPKHNETYNPELMRLSFNHYPFVLLDRNLQGLSLPFVSTDNAAAVRMAMEFVLDRGHRNVCLFAPTPTSTSTIEDRLVAFRQECSSHNLFCGAGNICAVVSSVLVNSPSEEQIAADVDAICAHLQANPNITCAFATEYSISRLVRMAARKLNLEIPRDLSLITFDNHNNVFRSNSTTYIRQEEAEIGRLAVEVMRKLLDGGKVETKNLVQPTIVDNGSVLLLKR